MNVVKYRKILERNLIKSAKHLKMFWKLIFQQDNHPKDKAKVTVEWLAWNKVDILEWLQQNPNLNSIEIYCMTSTVMQSSSLEE